MDTFRYIVTLLLVILIPGIVCYWLLLHSFLPLWRKLGVSVAQYFLWAAVIIVAGLAFSWRETLVRGDYGFQPLLAAAGVVCLAAALVFRLQIERFLPWSVQLGFPEIDPHGHPRRLVTEGPFAHTRHPRYIQILLALLGWALLVNYASAYLVALAWIPLALLIVRLEESELLRRFGVEYEEYAGRVARFWPHANGANHRVKA
jgi:protein-S-isoprenylcysteine O-methyltransferase Ste14